MTVLASNSPSTPAQATPALSDPQSTADSSSFHTETARALSAVHPTGEHPAAVAGGRRVLLRCRVQQLLHQVCPALTPLARVQPCNALLPLPGMPRAQQLPRQHTLPWCNARVWLCWRSPWKLASSSIIPLLRSCERPPGPCLAEPAVLGIITHVLSRVGGTLLQACGAAAVLDAVCLALVVFFFPVLVDKK